MKMTFGKHRGQDFEDIPTAYLQWVAESLDSHPALQLEAENQLMMREGVGVKRTPPADDRWKP